jgi:uncharacterized protein
MDITPAIAAGRQVVEGYGDGGFRVSGKRYEGNIIVTPTATYPWDKANEALSLDSLARVIEHAAEVDILLVGCGTSFLPIPTALKTELREHGIGADPMDTGAACRTYNVLMSEDRRVAVALRAVD